MSTTTTHSFSTQELQSAARALLAGRFAANTAAAGSGPQETSLLEEDRTWAPVAEGLGELVRVRAACAGAGCSTIALAIADAIEAAGSPVRLLDAASAPWSGSLAATSTELGADAGWRRGRRGALTTIDRLDLDLHRVSEVPLPRPVTQIGLTVLDAGWTQRELANAPDHWITRTPAQAEVVVGRATEQGLRQTEETLRALDQSQTLVVVVGHHKITSNDLLASGPEVLRLHEQGRVLGVPVLAPRSFPGVGVGALPKQLRTAGQQLLAALTELADLAVPHQP